MSLSAAVLYERQGSLIYYGQALYDFIINYYSLFLNYAFNIGGSIFRAWFGWPIIRTAPCFYSFFLPPLGYPRGDGP